MRTFRAHSSTTAIDATVPLGRLIVHAREGILAPTLTLSPQVFGDELAEQAINDAEIAEPAGTLLLAVPPRGAVNPVDSATVDQVPAGAVDAELVLPANITARLVCTDGSITTDGPLGVLTAHVSNGDLTIGEAIALTAGVYNGTISIERVQRVMARSNNGHVQVDTFTDLACLDTTNGSITVGCAQTERLSAHTINGDITVTTAAGVLLADTAVSTVHGRVQVR